MMLNTWLTLNDFDDVVAIPGSKGAANRVKAEHSFSSPSSCETEPTRAGSNKGLYTPDESKHVKLSSSSLEAGQSGIEN